MPILTESDVRGAARAEFKSQGRYGETFDKYAERSLSEHRRSARVRSHFDVFLSHSFRDREIILGLRDLLEKKGLSVYVDWIDDPHLDRTSVTPATAATIRQRMKQSTSLLYATSTSAASSKWMPWELGYFDGHKSKVGVVPIAADAIRPASYSGREYLSLYPYVGPCSAYSDASDLCIYDASGNKTPLKQWASGGRTVVMM